MGLSPPVPFTRLTTLGLRAVDEARTFKKHYKTSYFL
jgi:hypothetical protein